ncbi:MAG: hypothetical protein N2Z57_00350 [Oscillospiraceae bacterium]|nr:hypothetical protein [Oscillospiraceae bacterium]
MFFKKALCGCISSLIVVGIFSSVAVGASTKITTDSTHTITKNGVEGKTLAQLKEYAEDAFDAKHYDVDDSDFELTSGTFDSNGKTKNGQTYILICDDVDCESGYISDADRLRYKYVVDDEEIITKSAITEDGVSGKTLEEIKKLAAEAFNDYGYDLSYLDFDLRSGDLTSSGKTQSGETYVLRCTDPDVEDGYELDDDIDYITYKYVVDDDNDNEYEPTCGTLTGWASITDKIANSIAGSTVLIKMNGATNIPSTVFSAFKGKNVTVTFDFITYAWTVNGTSITAANTLNLGADFTSADISSATVGTVAPGRVYRQFKLNHNGSFGFTGRFTMMIDSKYSGKYANLYYYNPSTGRLEFQSSGLISSSGYATMAIFHASNYAVVIDNAPLGTTLSVGAPISDVTQEIATIE